MDKPIFSIKKLLFSINNVTVLNINNFDLHRGAMYLFSGFIGSGKTTLMNILAKNKNATSGEVYYEGKNILDIAKNKYDKEVIFLDQINF